MKHLLLTLCIAFVAQTASATEWFTYFVYVQSEYMQGPWTRANVLEKAGSKNYLYPKRFEELLSISGDGQDLANAIFQKLKTEAPDRYTFSAEIAVSGDTVILTTSKQIKDFSIVKDELTASLTLNGFQFVKIVQLTSTDILTENDITLPYFDIKSTPDKTTEKLVDLLKEDSKPKEGNSNLLVGLLASVAINGVLIFILLGRRK